MYINYIYTYKIKEKTNYDLLLSSMILAELELDLYNTNPVMPRIPRAVDGHKSATLGIWHVVEEIIEWLLHPACVLTNVPTG